MIRWRTHPFCRILTKHASRLTCRVFPRSFTNLGYRIVSRRCSDVDSGVASRPRGNCYRVRVTRCGRWLHAGCVRWHRIHARDKCRRRLRRGLPGLGVVHDGVDVLLTVSLSKLLIKAEAQEALARDARRHTFGTQGPIACVWACGKRQKGMEANQHKQPGLTQNKSLDGCSRALNFHCMRICLYSNKHELIFSISSSMRMIISKSPYQVICPDRKSAEQQRVKRDS